MRAGGASCDAPPVLVGRSRKDRGGAHVNFVVAAHGTSTTHTFADASESAVAVVTADPFGSRRITAALEMGGFAASSVSSSADALLASGARQALDAVVLVYGGMSGELLSAIRKLTAGAVDTHVVVVVPEEEWSCLRQALNAGATGLVYESELEATLVPTMRAALAGQIALPQRLRRCAVTPAFSHREKEVLSLVARGLPNQQIADKLYLAESTVKSHLSSAFQKLGVHSRKEAVALLVDPHEGLGRTVLGRDWQPGAVLGAGAH
jgi:DNA-binding NarL/FixJ family response regulator